MRRRNNIYVMIMILLAVSIGIGYSYLQTSLTVVGNITVRKYDPTRYLYKEIIKQNKENGAMVLDNQASTYVSASTGIDFNAISSTTNGQGVYVRNGTENDTYPIYYYRGAVTNNNVIFAGFCWNIVRTTETGGIKLIYNGTPTNGTCNNTGEKSLIGRGIFSSYHYDIDLLGYMFNNQNDDSLAKQMIDNWYSQNMTSYTSYLEDAVWCNDRTSSHINSHFPYYTFYGAYSRGLVDYFYDGDEEIKTNPSLECTNQNDRFTVYETMEGRENGNAALTYPVALLTADEVVFSGYSSDNGSINGYSNSYLNIDDVWWTLSPKVFDTGDHYMGLFFMTIYNGSLFSTSVADHSSDSSPLNVGMRPSISLKYGTKLAENGDGSANSPFVVQYN